MCFKKWFCSHEEGILCLKILHQKGCVYKVEKLNFPTNTDLAGSKYNKENDNMIKLLNELVSFNVICLFYGTLCFVVNVLVAVVHYSYLAHGLFSWGGGGGLLS